MAAERTIRSIVMRHCRELLTEAEKQDGSAWERALYAVADSLRGQGLDDLGIVVEARMPNNNARADYVLLGSGLDGARVAVCLELKMWTRCRATRVGRVTFRETTESDAERLHPCWQVLGYRDQLGLYAASLANQSPESHVHGLAFLPAMQDAQTLHGGDDERAKELNSSVVEECPAFAREDLDHMVGQIKDWAPAPPSPEFVEEFLEGRRDADQKLETMAENLLEHWPLIDQQMEAALVVEDLVDSLAVSGREQTARQVVLITGGPGSGKTILAVRILLRAIVKASRVNSAFVTTSGAHKGAITGEMQLQKLGHLLPFGMLSDLPIYSARDKVMKYLIPGHQTKKEAESSGDYDLSDDDWWKKHCRKWHGRFMPAVDQRQPEFDVMVCDEAQALVNIERDEPYARAAGWIFPAGPQAAHLIHKSCLSVFLMDGEQGYRDAESTSAEDIRDFAVKVGVQEEHIHQLNLNGLQFRLSGNDDYTKWLDWLLGMAPDCPELSNAPERLRDVFRVYDDPSLLRDHIRVLHDAGGGPCRLLAGYGWDWVSKKKADALKADSHDGLGTPFRKPPPGIRFRWLSPEEKQQAFNLGRHPFDDRWGEDCCSCRLPIGRTG